MALPYPSMSFVPLDILTAAEMNNLVANITSLAVDGSGFTDNAIPLSKLASINYSTTEVDTGQKWVDGKTIYKKTINFGALPNATSKKVAHNIASFSRVIRTEGVACYTNGVSLPLPFVSNVQNASVELSVNSTEITIAAGTNRSGATAYTTVYYTK